MPTPTWQPGTLYPTGSLVQPASAPPIVPTPIENPGFESGDVDWTKGTGWTIGAVGPFSGSNAAQYSFTGTSDIVNDAVAAVTPGQSITAACMVQQGASSAGQAGARVVLIWLTSGDVEISRSQGNLVDNASGGAWYASTVTAEAPATAAKVQVASTAFRNSGSNPLWVDQFTWNHTGPAVLDGLVYRAVQPTVGSSGSTEPVWPFTLGVQVNDGTVIWEAVAATRVVWEATPLFRTGMVEPDWPLLPGATVADGTLVWEAITRRVTDPLCPNKAATVILASHVFNEDDDIVRYCSALNPLDWTTEADAGFLASGMQGENANDVRVLASYRKNLAVLNASSFQVWQADPDPELMDMLDMKNGIGSIYHRAACSVIDDLFLLTDEGVRNVTQAAGNNSNTAGAVGAPVDDLVKAAVALSIADNQVPISTYYPGLGQYMLACPASGATVVFVATKMKGGTWSWSRYLFPFVITEFSLYENDLYFRHGDHISVFDDTLMHDELDATGAEAPVEFGGRVQWNWLDMGQAGTTKHMQAFELIATGDASVSFGYNERQKLTAWTDPYALAEADTLPEGPIQYEITAPTISVRVDFAPGAAWSLSSFIAYVDDLGPNV